MGIMNKIVCYFVIMFFVVASTGISTLPGVTAEEIVYGEEEQIFSEEILENLLLKIKTNLAEGSSVISELTLLESVRDEFVINQQNLESEVHKVREGISPSNLEEFEQRVSIVSEEPLRFISGLDDILINPTIGGIDSVLDMMDLFSLETQGETQGEILAVKPVLPRKVVSAVVSSGKRQIKLIDLPPTDADLSETDLIQFTPEIKALAEEMGGDAVDIFTYVRNEFDFVPYYGVRQGSGLTFIKKEGNDMDISSALIAALRYSNISSRYVMGLVEIPIDTASKWVGGKTPEATFAIFQSNGLLLNGGNATYKNGEMVGISFWHTWVSIYDGHQWRKADPSFKEYIEVQGTIPKVQSDGLDQSDIEKMFLLYEGDIISVNNTVSINYTSVEELFNQTFDDARNMTPEEWMTKMGMQITKREIIPKIKNNLQPYLAGGVRGDRKPTEEHSVLPEEFNTLVKIQMPVWGWSDLEYITTLAKLGTKRISLHYEPHSDIDQEILDDAGGIYNVSPLLVYMVPVLTIDGEVVAKGTSGHGLGKSRPLYVSFLISGFTKTEIPGVLNWQTSSKSAITGSNLEICISTGTSIEESQYFFERELKDLDSSNPDRYLINDEINKFLHYTGLLYFGIVDYLSQTVSSEFEIVAVNYINLGFVCKEIKPIGWMWLILRIDPGGAHIDVVRSVHNPVSKTGDSEDQIRWMMANGLIGTNMEHIIMELTFGIEAVSTGKIFSEAVKQGRPIHILNNSETLEADLALISANFVVKNNIRMAVKANYTVYIPQKEITLGNWTGQGWIIIDPETGGAGYMISGGLHNEVINGGSVIGSIILKLEQTISLMKIYAMGVAIVGIGGQITTMAVGLVSTYAEVASFTTLVSLTCFYSCIGVGLIFFGIWAYFTVIEVFIENMH